MELKEAIDIGRALGAKTIGDVIGVMSHLMEFGLLGESDWQEFWDQYVSWQTAYEETFGAEFENCKI